MKDAEWPKVKEVFSPRPSGNSLRDRTGGLLRRRKIEIAAASVIAMLLVGGLWVAIHEAERQRVVAQRHLDGVRQMANTLLFELDDEIAPLAGSTKARALLVNTSLESLNTLTRDSGADASLLEALGVAYRKVGDIQSADAGSNTGDPKAAFASYARSVELLGPLCAADPGNHGAGIALARAYLQQGRLTLATGGAATALPIITKAVALTEAHAASIEDDRARWAQLRDTYVAQADVLGDLGRTQEAMAALDKRAAADQALIALEPENARHHVSLAETRFDLAESLYLTAQYEKAIELYRQAAVVLRGKSVNPNDATARWTSTLNDLGLAKTLVKTGEYDEAGTLFADAERYLLDAERSADSSRIQLGLAVVGIRGGERYIALAADPRSNAAKRFMYRDLARELLEDGIARLRKAGESVALTGPNQKLLDEGVASLAKMGAGSSS